jgi:hypothetical protein
VIRVRRIACAWYSSGIAWQIKTWAPGSGTAEGIAPTLGRAARYWGASWRCVARDWRPLRWLP